jgi:nitrite reductase/ring-hydroxylating ferredoxin subunit
VTREPSRDARPTRRGMLAGAGAACLAGTLAACGTGGGAQAVATATSGWKKSSGSGSSDTHTSTGTSGGGGDTSGLTELASASDIPEGGGMIFQSAKVVVTQPTAGEYKAFSAICTHEQCIVDQVADGTIDCPCHGSKFSITDGAVETGPAPSPLPTESIKVSDGKVYLA